MNRRLSNAEIGERLTRIEDMLAKHHEELAWYRFMWRVLKIGAGVAVLLLTLKLGDIPNYIHKGVVAMMSS